MSIGQRIKTMRKQQGLSIDDLAYRLGKNRTTVYRYENGDIENLPLGILDSLANALNTTPAYLMGWENYKDDYCDYIEINRPEARHLLRWYDEFGSNVFNDEEHQKLIEYGKFLLSIRED
jgi:transcriptional regulator with XRE-family HTH domain